MQQKYIDLLLSTAETLHYGKYEEINGMPMVLRLAKNDKQPEIALCWTNVKARDEILMKVGRVLYDAMKAGCPIELHERFRTDKIAAKLVFDIDYKCDNGDVRSVQEKFYADICQLVVITCHVFGIDCHTVAICPMFRKSKLSAHVVFTRTKGYYCTQFVALLDELKKHIPESLLYLFKEIDVGIFKRNGWGGLRMPVASKNGEHNKILPDVRFHLTDDYEIRDDRKIRKIAMSTGDQFGFLDICLTGNLEACAFLAKCPVHGYEFNDETCGCTECMPDLRLKKKRKFMIEKIIAQTAEDIAQACADFDENANVGEDRPLVDTVEGNDKFGRPLKKVLELIPENILKRDGKDLYLFRQYNSASSCVNFWFNSYMGSYHCTFCDRVHGDKLKNADNNLFVFINETNIRIGCVKMQKTTKTICVMLPTELRVAIVTPIDYSKYKTKFSADETYYSSEMRDYPICPQWFENDGQHNVLAIRAQMGIGKSTKLREMLQKLPNIGSLRICLVSFRRSFTINQIAEYNNALKDVGIVFKSYLERAPGEKLDVQYLMIQMESLKHLKDNFKYDLLIIDEYISVVEQMFSEETHKASISKNIENFKRLICHTKNVVLMDANICDEYVKFVKDVKCENAEAAKFKYYAVENTCKPNKDHVVNVFESYAQILNVITNYVATGKSFVICSTISKGDTKAIGRILSDAGKKVLTITSDTCPDEKDRIFRNINDIVEDYDQVIYSPTMTAGVSILSDKFTDMFIIATPRTCGPLIVSQMAGRFRKVKNFKIWVNPVGLKATEDLEKLNDMYMKNIENQTLFEWDNATNTKKIKNAAYYNIFINSMCMINKQKNSFKNWLLACFDSRGAQIKFAEPIKKGVIQEVIITEEEAARIANVEFITMSKEKIRDVVVRMDDEFAARVAAAGFINEEDFYMMFDCGKIDLSNPDHMKTYLANLYVKSSVVVDLNNVEVIKKLADRNNMEMFKTTFLHRNNLLAFNSNKSKLCEWDIYTATVGALRKQRLYKGAEIMEKIKVLADAETGRITYEQIAEFIVANAQYLIEIGGSVDLKFTGKMSSHEIPNINVLLNAVGYNLERATKSKKNDVPYVLKNIADELFNGRDGMPLLTARKWIYDIEIIE